jgi:hypothetical protein
VESSTWSKFWKQIKHERVGYDGVNIEKLMEWYSHTIPPFGPSAEKRKEFPDAITL